MKKPTPSSWMLLGLYENGKRLWRVYRMKNLGEPDNSDNREFYGKPTPRRECALDLCKALNAGELQAREQGGAT